MKAVGYYQSLPIDHPDALLDLELPEPTPGPRDLLVEVRAISVNPVDTKVRQRAQPEAGQARVLGWDAAGVVRAVGSEVSLFRPGDRVWYAGDITRPGSNSELHRVDERIAGHLPKSLDFAQAAALPLTTITAWELLFERLQIVEGKADQGQSLLVVGAAGGVGSILVQLARRLTGLNVIGTASRAETQAWVSAREAVPITFRPVSRRASWTRIEPTPPAAPTTSRLWPWSALPSTICKRSKSSSQAVMVVSGRAAAWAKSRLFGRCPAMRSSTRCSSLLLPGRVISPAYQTRSPGRNRLTSLPTARTTPAASQPSTLAWPASGWARWRTLVSTGLTEMARTSTSRSRGPGVGSGSSRSSRASGWSMGRDW